MTTSRTTRRALAAATVVATTACTLVGAPAADAAQNAPGPKGPAITTKAKSVRKAPAKKAPAKKAARPGAAGFAPVRTLKGKAIAMTSPAQGQLWIAERVADGTLMLEHQDGKQWRTYRMPVKLDSYADVEVHGSARDDVWLVADGTLWRFEKRNWRKVSLPAGTKATAVQDVAGTDVYVGLDGDTETTGVYRLRGSRWVPLGRPTEDEEPYGPAWRPADLRVAGGKVFANWIGRARSAAHWENSFVYEGKTWTDTFQTLFMGGGHTAQRGAWLVPDAGRQISLGSSRSFGDKPQYPTCQAWTKAGGAASCGTRWAVGAAALMGDGRIVVGGDDLQHPSRPKVEGTFGVRLRNGSERLVAGDPGERTLAMTVEPGTGTAWAATQAGEVTTLQSWRG